MKKIIILIMFAFTTLIFAIENDDFDIRASKYDARTRLVNATISNRAYNIDFKEAVFELIGYDERSRPIRIKYLYINDFYYNNTIEISFYLPERVKYTNKFDVEFVEKYSEWREK